MRRTNSENDRSTARAGAAARSGRLTLALAVAAAVIPSAAIAQRPITGSPNLRDLLTNFLSTGIVLARPQAGTDHSAHFVGTGQPQFVALQEMNRALADQLSGFPLTSSAGGFTYQFDPAMGVFDRRSPSFGPVYTERALTIGKGKFNIGVNYSTFTFNHLDDLDLKNGDMRLVFTHSDTNRDGSHYFPFVEGDLIASILYLDLRTDITALVATYGIHDRLDLSLAVPVVGVEITAASHATVQRLATADTLQEAHRFSDGSSERTFHERGSAAGLGDIVLRGKYQFLSESRWMLAALGEVGFPTGEVENLLGTGGFRGKGSVIGSLRYESLSPHGAVGYSIAEGGLPEELSYATGCDLAVDSRVTFAADILGRRASGVSKFRVEEKRFTANRNPAGPPYEVVSADFPILMFDPDRSRHSLEASFGFKLNVIGSILITANGLVALTDSGLRDSFTPLVGIDYSF